MGVVRIAIPPIDKTAAEKASARLYQKHPDLAKGGVRTPLDVCNPSHDPLRREWIDLYERYGGKTEVSSLTHSCGRDSRFAYALILVSLSGVSSHAGGSYSLVLQDDRMIVAEEEFANAGVFIVWELPVIDRRYAITARYRRPPTESLEFEKALEDVNAELAKVEREHKHWNDEDAYEKPRWQQIAEDLVTPDEPYGADPEGHRQEQADRDEEFYRENMRRLHNYRLELEQMKLTLLAPADQMTVSVMATAGTAQVIVFPLRVSKAPDHAGLLKRTPRRFEWNLKK